MKDLLPFLLGLIFLGVKYYNKTQKDRAAKSISQESLTEESPKESSSLDDFIQQFYTQEAPVVEAPIMVANEDEEEEYENWMEQKYIEEPESIEYTDETSRNIKHEAQFEMIQNKQGQTVERLDFDLKKAIIYDAIMNPPYL